MSAPQTLTPEQRQRIEENRRRAMELKASKNRRESLVAQSTASVQKPNGQTVPSSAQNRTASSFYSASFNASAKQPRLNFKGSVPSTNPQSKFVNDNYIKGTLSLISRDRFELQMDYHQPAIELVKTVPGRLYDSSRKSWNFPFSQYQTVLSKLKTLQPHVVIAELPNLIVDTFSKVDRGVSSCDVDLSRIQKSMISTLMDFQMDGVKFAVSKGGRVLIADDMGLGKTIQALAFADFYRDQWPLLIVCPSSMRFQWLEEIHKYLSTVPHHSITVITNGKDSISRETCVVITSYDLMASSKDDLYRKNFGVVIMDESHLLKNAKTKRTQVATELLKKCHRCVLLSGTPVLSRPQELFCQLHAVKPSVFKNSFEFGIRYCDGKKERFGWNFSGSSNMLELKLLISELVMIRRLKCDVLSQLPPKRREVVFIESVTNKLSDTSEFARILKEEGLRGMKKHSTLLQYFHETGESKKKGIMQYVQDMIENGEKFLIFAHHCQVLDAICEAVESMGVDYIRIDGSVSSDERKAMCNHFQENEKCMVAALSIKAANTGLTLTAAHLVIFAELYWNPADLTQGEDRAHRIGQGDSVLVQYLVQRGTADDLMWPLIQNKLNVLSTAGLSQDDFREADTKVLKSKDNKNIKDYFQSTDDDADLAGLNLQDFEEDFFAPECKKPKIL